MSVRALGALCRVSLGGWLGRGGSFETAATVRSARVGAGVSGRTCFGCLGLPIFFVWSAVANDFLLFYCLVDLSRDSLGVVYSAPIFFFAFAGWGGGCGVSAPRGAVCLSKEWVCWEVPAALSPTLAVGEGIQC